MSSKPKIVFIINSIQQQRCLKRIEKFIDNGYEVEAYGFSRSETIPTKPKRFTIQVLDTFTAGMSYANRFVRMLKALRPVMKKYKHERVVYYYFLLDVAMAGRLISSKPYIYEESDLMQTYLPQRWLVNCLDKIDRYLIRHSHITTMTSEGFAQYHFGTTYPTNIVFVPNRLNRNILDLPYSPTPTDIKHLRFAVVGGARFDSVVHFAQTIATYFPQHEMHFYGTLSDHKKEFETLIDTYENVYYHGPFSNPADLPSIYENVDLVLATYDNQYANVRYAEPNKLYEAAYFKTPIIVSEGTYLASKVEKWGIGYALNALDTEAVKRFVGNLCMNSIQERIDSCSSIEKSSLMDINPDLFRRIGNL